jgi:hypothetical protein
MRALVVFESMFGNTEAVARAVADGLSTQLEVDVVAVDEAPPDLPDDAVLLVVGGPTHAMGMSRPRTRQDAARQDGSPPVRGMREWLGDVARPLAGVLGAAFDTRVHAPVPGSAARGESKRLRRLGVQLIAPATTFWVGGTPGPVLGGELDRARRWGEQLAHEVLAAHRPAGRP